MKTLPDIVRDARLLLASMLEKARNVSVVIARGSHEPLDARSQAFQITLFAAIDEDGDIERWCEARAWLGEHWSSWHRHQGWLGGPGFDLADVLATDWRIAS